MRSRYQIKGVSGWQYGIQDLEKLNTDSLITTIESQKEEIEKWRKEAFANHPTQWAYDQACKALNSKTLAVESLQKENEQLRHRDRVVSLTNETLGRYVREGKEEIARLKLTPMLRMSESMDSLSHIQEGKSREFTVEESKMHSEILNENSVVVKNLYYQEGEK